MSERLWLPKTVLVDQDGVVVNFEQGFQERWREVYPNRPYISLNDRRTFYVEDDYPQEYRQEVKDLRTSPGLYTSLTPIVGAIDVLIDDRPEVTGDLTPTWAHVLFDQPYNREVVGKKRIRDWEHWKEDLLQH